MFNDKFKDRTPIETIQIIKDFFIQRNFLLIKNLYSNTEAGTYSCQYKLYYNDIFILLANGKGLTLDFCEASCLAEMYERFCNLYFLRCQNIPLFDNYKKQNNINKFIYLNLNNHNITKEINPLELYPQINSNGMAAGNTLEEALNQGISEIFERYVTFEFYQNKIDKYYILEKNDINNNIIKDLITNIETHNNKIYFIDFSYNYNLSVIGCVCIDLNTNGIKCSFGSFPIFDIAIERCITELYQNVNLSQRIKTNFCPIPNDFFELRLQDKGNIGLCGYLPNSFLSNKNYIFPHKYNTDIFVDEKLSNLDLLNVNKQLAQQANIDLFYKDVSLTKEITAIHIISNKSNINIGTPEYLQQLTDKQKNNYQFLIENSKYLIKDIIYNNITAKDFIKKYYDFFMCYIQIQKEDSFFYPATQFCDQSNLFNSIKIYSIIGNLIINQFIDISQINSIENSIFYKQLKLLYSIVTFKEKNQYSDEDIYRIFNNLNIKVSIEFIKNCTNLEYILEECYFKPIRDNYLVLQEFIKTLVITDLT